MKGEKHMKGIFFNALYFSGTVVAGAFALAATVAFVGAIIDMIKDIVRGKR